MNDKKIKMLIGMLISYLIILTFVYILKFFTEDEFTWELSTSESLTVLTAYIFSEIISIKEKLIDKE